MTTRLGIGLATIGLGVLLTGCGGGDSDFTDQSGKQIAKDSKAAMKDLDAVKVSGSVKTGSQEITIDVQTNDDGDCSGSIGTGGGTAELLGVGGDVWFKPDEAFWKASAGDSASQILALVGDKWVVIPGNGDSFDQFCDIDKLLEQLLEVDDDAKDSDYVKGKVEKIDGDDVIPIDNMSKGSGTSTGYVLVDEPHYLVKIDKADGDNTGTVTFSEFDKEVEVEAPAADDVIDLDKLTG